MYPLENKIRDFIARHKLLMPRKRYLVALSGGADSVCLLRVLQQLGYQIEAVHCNFHLRGEESDRDEQFCEELCKVHNIPFHRVHFDTRSYAELHHLSIEMAARELRYHYFNKLSQAIDAQGVCVAHHRDDNVETILMNLLRGTGIHGLSGMHPLSHLPIVGNDGKQVTTLLLRPLLCVSRQEIEDYLQQIGQSFVTDSSNLEADVVRNKIRLQVLPLLEEINPAARENISLSAERVDRAEQLFGEALEDRCKAAIIDETEHFVTFSIAALLHNEYILFTCLRPYGFSSTQCEDIYALLSRKEHDLLTSPQWMSASHTAVAERGVLVLFRIDDPHLAENLKPRKLPLAPENSAAAPLTYNLGAMGRYELSAVEKNVGFIVDKSPAVACLDAEMVQFPLTIRPAAEGDRFQPYGMKGTKLVSDYLTDRKRSIYAKRCQLVMTDAKGQILWLIGERTADSCAVTKETRQVLVITRLRD
ncbi:MAG: tRNA lysidine(34) synthetase TilS [Prevotella sp.]|nr:tRNA lysidine(34) synthetase TilS [Prevotella sp.]